MIKILSRIKQLKIGFYNVKGRVILTGRATSHHHGGKKTTCLLKLAVRLDESTKREVNVIPC